MQPQSSHTLTFTPVSYTHLDVYKRQDMSTQQKAELDKEKRKEEKKEAKRAKRQHYRELNEPQKLTVLEEVGKDVYKRQLLRIRL